MEFTEITTLIGSYGFPIIMCLVMMKNNNKTVEKFGDILRQNTAIVDKNTTVLKELSTLIKFFITGESKGADNNE